METLLKRKLSAPERTGIKMMPIRAGVRPVFSAEKALLGNAWWIILIPGLFLVVTLVCITELGNYLRRSANRKQSNL